LLSSIPSAVFTLRTDPQIVPAALVQLAAAVLVPWLVIMYVFKSRLRRSFQAWLPTLASGAAIAALGLLVVRPFLVETFSVPTNAMAPTLRGNHVQGTCPECGRPTIATVPAFAMGSPSARLQSMICENFHVSQGMVGTRVFLGDRFLVAKYLKPRRWDLVVFRNPREPSECYVKRLVGLPGEEILIKGGAVWANGTKLTPPDSIREIKYLSEFPQARVTVWGSADHPAQLAADEYFVLGDFSANSEDSRFWTQGAPGHHPFAVPESYVCGIVTHICWPPQRWRILR
jgi:signal peptidase I